MRKKLPITAEVCYFNIDKDKSSLKLNSLVNKYIVFELKNDKLIETLLGKLISYKDDLLLIRKYDDGTEETKELWTDHDGTDLFLNFEEEIDVKNILGIEEYKKHNEELEFKEEFLNNMCIITSREDRKITSIITSYDGFEIIYDTKQIINGKEEIITTSFPLYLIKDIKRVYANEKDLDLLNRLMKSTNINIEEIPVNDKKVIEMFSNKTSINNHNLSGIIEFSSEFYNKQLDVFKPNNLNEVSKLLALAYSTGGWNNNAELLLKLDIVSIDKIPTTLEELSEALKSYNIDKEKIDKIILNFNKKLKEEIPAIDADWFDDYISKVFYLHRQEKIKNRVLLSYKLAWFKLYYPKEFHEELFVNNKDLNIIDTKLLKQIENNDNELSQLNVHDYDSLESYSRDLNYIKNKKTILNAMYELNASKFK